MIVQYGDKVDLARMEEIAKDTLELSGDYAEQLKLNLSFISLVSEITHERDYEALDSPLICEALEHIGKDINGYIKPLADKLEEQKKELKCYQNQQYFYEDKEHERIMKRNKLESELRQCGLFEGERQKELQSKLKALESPIEAPKSLQESIDRAKGLIDYIEQNLQIPQDKLKGALFYRDEIYRHCPNSKAQKQEQKKEATLSAEGTVTSRLKTFKFSF